MKPRILPLALLLGIAAAAPSRSAGASANARGHQFVAFTSFSTFIQTQESSSDEIVLLSPLITSAINFTEVIVSWNAQVPEDCRLAVEARVAYPAKSTKYYALGLWSIDPTRYPRQSVGGQSDEDGDVSTDVLILRRPAKKLQLRLRITGGNARKLSLKFLGISLTDTNFSSAPLAPLHKAWDKLIEVPERSQMIYPGGRALCSPTTVSMLMGYWAQSLNRPELDRPVPKIAEAIYDSHWQGTGNWPFNTAYAGSFPGLRAYVARLSDISELEAWIVKNIPVGLSLDYDRLRAKGPGPNGHLVVLVGFTKQGDPIINDPGTSEHVRKVFSRRNLLEAWACSRNTVYLIYPENMSPPKDQFGHWDSKGSRAFSAE